MEMRFTPEHKNINELFGRDIKYLIPEYQRPYSWDCLGKSDKNNQVNVMWSDLVDYFEGDKNNTYFFGSMVLIGNGNQEYQVIDGQQRLTTMVLLFAAVKCFLNEIKPGITAANLVEFADTTIAFVDDVLYNKRLFGATAVEKKLKIEKSSGFDYDKVLTEAIECRQEYSADLAQSTMEQQSVVKRYFNNVAYFKEQIGLKFLSKGVFTEKDAETLNNFIEFLKTRVSVVRILTPTFEVAYHIFEILNNRGLPLSNKDLFRNLLIREWDALKNSDPVKYSHIVPLDLWNELDTNYEFQDDFIGRWVESYKAAKQQYSAFNDIKEIYEKEYKDIFPKKKIELFYDDIKRDLGFYTKIVNNTFEDPFVRAKVNFILYAPNYRYSVNFLLALVKSVDGYETVEFKKLLGVFERYIVFYLLCARFTYGPINEAISYLIKKQFEDAYAVIDEIVDYGGLTNNLMNYSVDNETGKLLLAKVVWHNEAITNDDMVEQYFDFDKATLEHIIPQITTGTKWEDKFGEFFLYDYTYRIGNMTLLTTKINSRIKNAYFDVKKKEYAKTKLPMTLELANIEGDITEDYIENRHQHLVRMILDDLGISYP
jgi:uncharacterized protein with ParB-like and HNH nuclease domain